MYYMEHAASSIGIFWLVLSADTIFIGNLDLQNNDKMMAKWGHISQRWVPFLMKWLFFARLTKIKPKILTLFANFFIFIDFLQFDREIFVQVVFLKFLKLQNYAYFHFILKSLSYDSLGDSLKCSKNMFNTFKLITHISCRQKCLRNAAAKRLSTFDNLKL